MTKRVLNGMKTLQFSFWVIGVYTGFLFWCLLVLAAIDAFLKRFHAGSGIEVVMMTAIMVFPVCVLMWWFYGKQIERMEKTVEKK